MQRAQTPFFRVPVGNVDRPCLRSLRREQSNKLGSLEATRWSSCSSSVLHNLVEAETIDVRFHLDPDGSINNAEIICTVRSAARNDQSASLRISAYTALAMQQLVCVRSRQECACASEATLASPPRTH